jgi:hypothetical protein
MHSGAFFGVFMTRTGGKPGLSNEVQDEMAVKTQS